MSSLSVSLASVVLTGTYDDVQATTADSPAILSPFFTFDTHLLTTMVYPEYLFDCPSIPPTPAPVLSDQQCAELDAFKAHFGHRGYAVPNSIGGMTKAPLTEREMMFLVSVLPPARC